ncbi:MAG: class I SAM-dependent methyltransferase [Pseudomonadota bacterium]
MSVDPETLAAYEAAAPRLVEAGPRPVPLQPTFADLLPEGGRVLDLGSGAGWHLAWFRERGFRADGVEPSRTLSELGATAHGAEARSGHFLTLSARQRYDALWCNFALHHALRPDRPAIFERIHTALRPGGWLFVSVPKGPSDWRDSLGRLMCPYTQGELEDLLVGFDDLRWERDAGETLDGARVLEISVIARRV